MADHGKILDAAALIERRDGLYATDLLITAIGHLDFFEWLGHNPSSPETICTSLNLSARPADVMVSLFTAMGLIQCDSRGVYSLTELARTHLVSSAPANLGPYFSSLRQRPVCADILTVLRTGTPFGWAGAPADPDWAHKMEDEAFALAFTAAMDGRGAFLSPPLANAVDCSQYHRLLDIAGGSGVYACAFAERYQNLHVAVLEKSPVDRASARSLALRGYQNRVEVITGDMFKTPLPTGFDLHLFSHVIHDWDIPEVRHLLQASFDTLMPGGMIIIHDAHLSAEKTGPLPVAEFSVFLMLCTRGKCYSVREMTDLLEETGFQEIHYQATIAHRSVLLARKPLTHSSF